MRCFGVIAFPILGHRPRLLSQVSAQRIVLTIFLLKRDQVARSRLSRLEQLA